MYLQTIASLSAGSGGTSRCVSDLGGELATLGAEVAIVTSEDSCSEETIFRPDNSLCRVYTSLDQGTLGKLAFPFYELLQQIVVSRQVRLIHDHGIWLPTNIMAARAARKSGIPLVISTHGMVEPWSLSQSSARKKIALQLYQKKIFQQAELFFATSEPEAAHIRSLGLSQPIAVIPNGVHMPEQGCSLPGRNVNRSRTILFLSRIHKKKGLLNLVRAWGNIRESGWRFIIAGADEGGYRSEVEKEINRLGVGHFFEFVGPLYDEQKEQAFLGADIFVLPTYSENFGIVVAEAMSHSVPVITTTGTPWESISEEKIGWWVPPTVEGIEGALHEAISLSDEERACMGASARKHVEENYSWPTIAQNVLAVYDWVLGGKDKPDCVLL